MAYNPIEGGKVVEIKSSATGKAVYVENNGTYYVIKAMPHAYDVASLEISEATHYFNFD